MVSVWKNETFTFASLGLRMMNVSHVGPELANLAFPPASLSRSADILKLNEICGLKKTAQKLNVVHSCPDADLQVCGPAGFCVLGRTENPSWITALRTWIQSFQAALALVLDCPFRAWTLPPLPVPQPCPPFVSQTVETCHMAALPCSSAPSTSSSTTATSSAATASL